MGKDQIGPPVGGGVVGAGEGEVLEVVLAEIVGGDDEGDAAGGEGEVGDEAGAAEFIPAVVEARIVGLGPVEMKKIGVRGAQHARERHDALVVAEEADVHAVGLEGLGEETLVGNAAAPIGGEEDVHFLHGLHGEKDAIEALQALGVKAVAHRADVMARDGIFGGVLAERDFIGARQQAALAVPGGAEHEQRLLDAPDVAAEDGSLGERAVAEIEIDGAFHEQAEAAIHARPDFHAQLRPRFGGGDEGALLHVFIEPAFVGLPRYPIEDFAWVIEEEQVAVEDEKAVACREMRDVENLERQRVRLPVVGAEGVTLQKRFDGGIGLAAGNDLGVGKELLELGAGLRRAACRRRG